MCLNPCPGLCSLWHDLRLLVKNRGAQSSQVEVSENPLSVNIYNPQDIRLFAVRHGNKIVLPVAAFHEVFGNFEHDVFVDPLFLEGFKKIGMF